MTSSSLSLFAAINSQMPGEIQSAVKRANVDDNVKVIILGGSGRAFCAGYDLKMSAENERGEINIGEVICHNIIVFLIIFLWIQCMLPCYCKDKILENINLLV